MSRDKYKNYKNMKKILLILFAFLGLTITASAQAPGTCRVSGGNGATIIVSVVDYDAYGNVEISIASDCDDFVNVSFTLTYYVSGRDGGERTSQVFVETAQPNSNTPKIIKIRNDFSDYKRVTNITRVNVSGARCDK